jgi:hypothetical protein
MPTYYKHAFYCPEQAHGVSPKPCDYYLEKQGEELTFVIKGSDPIAFRVTMKGSLYETKQIQPTFMIMYIGAPRWKLVDWIIHAYRTAHNIIPDSGVIQHLLEEASYFVPNAFEETNGP